MRRRPRRVQRRNRAARGRTSAAGAGRLIAVDLSEHALSLAKRLGATHTINPSKGHVNDAVYDLLPKGPDLVIESAGPIAAVKLMVSLLRRGTRWNVFGITTHEKFELDGGLMHFLEARMDASFGTTPLAMEKAIMLMERGLVDPGRVIAHRFPLTQIHQAVVHRKQVHRRTAQISRTQARTFLSAACEVGRGSGQEYLRWARSLTPKLRWKRPLLRLTPWTKFAA